MDENTFTSPDGIVYEATWFDDCDDDNGEGHCAVCEFEGDCMTIRCCAAERDDRREVYWIRRGPAPRSPAVPVKDPNPL